MEASELRIGNYIYDRSGKILRIDWWENINKVCMDMNFGGEKVHPLTENAELTNPIPLTEEWLDKFGFEENTTSFTKIEGRHHYVVKLRKSHKRFHSFTHKPIDFVHDLQNLYFALTGEELTIKNK